MSPYIDLKEESCSSCDRPARAKVVLMPNGFVVRACAEHLVELAFDVKGAEED
jgi:hypothetical protein